MRLSRRLFLVGLAGVPGACTSPNPTLYVLAGVPGPTLAGAPRTIELRTIGLARYLERSQIVRSSDDYRVDVLANEWWAEPLDAMLGRILVEELGQRLPGSAVYSESGAISAAADATVEVNLQRFDLDRAGALLLIAQIAVSGRGSARGGQPRDARFTVRPAAATTPALVAAMSTATGRLADAIAAMLTRGPQA